MEKKQGVLGGFRGQQADGGTDGADPPSDRPGSPQWDHVEAYEEDWYRSLKALAERQAQLAAGEEEEKVPAQEGREPEPEAPEGAQEPTEEPGEPAEVRHTEVPTSEVAEVAEPAGEAPIAESVEPEAHPPVDQTEATPTREVQDVAPPQAEVEAPEAPTTAESQGTHEADLETGGPKGPGVAEFDVPGGPGVAEFDVPEAQAPEEAEDLEAPVSPALGPLDVSSSTETEEAMGVEDGTASVEPAPPPAEIMASPSPAEEPPEWLVARTPEPVPTEPSLTARDPAERRRALDEILARGPSEGDLESIATLVLEDPDQEIRRLALETLSGRADRVEDTTIRHALQDPADEVRAVAVRLAAERGSRDLALLAPLVGARRWPLTQQTLLDVLPEIAASTPALGDNELDSLLASIGEMDPPPSDAERVPLAELTRAVGVSRLVGSLGLPDGRRRGAVRLLAGDDAPEILRALSALTSDPEEEIRNVAKDAAGILARAEAEAAQQRESAEEAPPGPEETERIASLARSLRDLDESVRHVALSGLGGMDRAAVLVWAREALHAGDLESASAAAEAVSALRLYELAVDVLNRAIELAPEARHPFVQALGSLRLEDLVGLLEQVDEARKPEAIRLLWQAGAAPVLPHLRAHLDDPSIPVRMAVLEVMGESGDPSAVDLARFVLETDHAAALRAAAVRVIGRASPDPSSVLSQALDDPDPVVRITALEQLTGDLGGDAEDILFHALSDMDEQVRRAAMSQLASRPDNDLDFVWSALRQCRAEERAELGSVFSQTNPGVLTELALHHFRSPDQEQRVLAVELAGWSKTPACVEAAIHALQDPVPAVRRAATTSLTRLRDSSAAQALGKALSDPSPDVRIGAVEALGVVDDESALGFLISALQDPEPRVRSVASEVLTQWSSPAVAKRLAGVLAVPGLRETATELLKRIGPSSVELLIDVLLQGGAAVAPTVGYLLQDIVGLPELVGRLTSMEAEARLRAVEALGAIGGPEAVDALVGTLSDPDERIRIRSTRLLAESGDPRAATAIARTTLQDPVAEVMAAAAEALARLGSEDRPQLS